MLLGNYFKDKNYNGFMKIVETGLMMQGQPVSLGIYFCKERLDEKLCKGKRRPYRIHQLDSSPKVIFENMHTWRGPLDPLAHWDSLDAIKRINKD